jgi:hypothetical protein
MVIQIKQQVVKQGKQINTCQTYPVVGAIDTSVLKKYHRIKR